ncbi:CHAD domain-containing protein [Mesorhizobium sp. IMUNJ 23232]|uniref:CYTH and CHAD domain-containing protein n=1 Tax=Mesorhizobium sp. IMUNJ 23232 TaxID=3376064 RepID=UPI0037AC4F02
MSEIELKLILDEATAKALWGRARALKLASSIPRTKTLRSIYLDTPEHALKKAGMSLRLRRDGRRWIQTVKTGREMHGGLSQAGEIENLAPGGRINIEAIPDETVRQQVAQRVNGGPLAPVCETVIRRAAGEVCLKDGTRAELAVDVGDILCEGRSAGLREAEIELIEGNPAGLFDIAKTLFPEGGLKFSRLYKAARGYLLAEKGFIDPPLKPRNAKAVAADPMQIAEQTARDILRECLDQIAINITATCELDDPEGPHQLRVGLRRLRSVFAVYRQVLDSPEMRRLGEEARWLGQEVGGLRDLDVVGQDIVRREAGSHLDETGLTDLADRLAVQAGERRLRLRKLLIEPRVQCFLLDLARFVETRGWLVPEDFTQTERLAMPVSHLAEAALAKCWKKVCKRARHLETLTVEERHEFRKMLKRLRYAVEFFASLYASRRVEPFLKRLKKLQEVFGNLNDAATVKALLSRSDLAADARSVGWMVGATQARAEFGWAGAKSLWRSLEETRPFWR